MRDSLKPSQPQNVDLLLTAIGGVGVAMIVVVSITVSVLVAVDVSVFVSEVDV